MRLQPTLLCKIRQHNESICGSNNRGVEVRFRRARHLYVHLPYCAPLEQLAGKSRETQLDFICDLERVNRMFGWRIDILWSLSNQGQRIGTTPVKKHLNSRDCLFHFGYSSLLEPRINVSQ